MVVLAAAMMLPPAPLLAVGRGVNPIWFTPNWLAKYNPILRYASIPMVAGLLNWATNRLAIVMMFYPLRFRGIGRIGWQGIVPGKAKSMANRIVDDVMFRLIDLRTIFARLPPERIATALEPLVLSVGEGLARDLIARKGWEGFASEAAVTSNAFTEAVRAQGHALVADFVRDVQAEPTAVFDLRDVVVRGVASDPRVLVDLFERCGEQDLRFVVNSGLVLGGLLGVAQMLLWIVFNPWWSLALTGAAVGMVTDQLALKLIFEPVEPKRIGPFTFQGLFLRRQEQVRASRSPMGTGYLWQRNSHLGSHAPRKRLRGVLRWARSSRRSWRPRCSQRPSCGMRCCKARAAPPSGVCWPLAWTTHWVLVAQGGCQMCWAPASTIFSVATIGSGCELRPLCGCASSCQSRCLLCTR